MVVENADTSAIIGDGPNLWDGIEIVPEYVPPVVELEPEPTPEPEPVVEEPEPVIEEPIPEPEPVVEPEPEVVAPTPEPVVEEPEPIEEPEEPRPSTWVAPTPKPIDEDENQDQQTNNNNIDQNSPVSQPEPETIIEKKLITVTVYEEPEASNITQTEESEDNSSVFMIVIPAICVGVLLIVAVLIVIHFCKKKSAH